MKTTIESRYIHLLSATPPPPLRRSRWRGVGLLSICAVALQLAGCAAPWQRVAPGDSAERVRTTLGAPKEVYPLSGGGQRWLWPTRPFGETTTAAEIDPSGKLLSVQQVLTNNAFAQAEIGKWTQQDVQQHFGIPEEKTYYPLMKRAVWSYRYMDDDVWYMLYHFSFDDNGVLRGTLKSPDPLHEPGDRNGLF